MRSSTFIFHNNIRNYYLFSFSNYGVSRSYKLVIIYLQVSNYLLKENIVFEQSLTKVEIAFIKECSLY